MKVSTGGQTDFTMYYPYLDNAVYTITINEDEYNVPVTNNQLYLTYTGPWNATRDNFTVAVYGTAFNTENTMNDLIWLLIIFIVPIAMVQFLPKIGFIGGMSLSLLVFGFADTTFLPYVAIGFLSIVAYVYKRG